MKSRIMKSHPTSGNSRDLLFYLLPDEVIFRRHTGMNASDISALCNHARTAAMRLCDRYHTRSAMRIAGRLGVAISRHAWHTAGGRILYLGEGIISPPQIRINIWTIQRLAKILKDPKWEFIGPRAENQLDEAVAAHELYHLVEHRGSCMESELAAHTFVRELLSLHYSPLVFHQALSLSEDANVGTTAESAADLLDGWGCS